MSEDEVITKFLMYLINRYPESTIIDDPVNREVRIEDLDRIFHYEYILALPC